MLRLRNSLGAPIDPKVYNELQIAGNALKLQGDPNALQTVELIKRNIEAPGFPFGGSPANPTSGNISDLNPSLQTIAVIRENPYPVMAAVIAIPLLAFLLGRASRR